MSFFQVNMVFHRKIWPLVTQVLWVETASVCSLSGVVLFEKRSHVDQAGLEVTMWLRMALNLCLHLGSARITDLCHRALLVYLKCSCSPSHQVLGLERRPSSCWASAVYEFCHIEYLKPLKMYCSTMK